jgi:hypothetical protein
LLGTFILSLKFTNIKYNLKEYIIDRQGVKYIITKDIVKEKEGDNSIINSQRLISEDIYLKG